MYHGTNKTALKSQKRILEALLNLMEQEEYNNITVKNICRQADISRQTPESLLRIPSKRPAKDMKNRCMSVLPGMKRHLRICSTAKAFRQSRSEPNRKLKTENKNGNEKFVHRHFTDSLYDIAGFRQWNDKRGKIP